MTLISLTNSNEISLDVNCINSTLKMYNYMQGNRVQLNQMVCSEASIKTNTNRGVITSSLNDGSFLLEVKAIKKRFLTEADIFGMEPPINDARDFFNSEPFVPVPGPFTGWNNFLTIPVHNPSSLYSSPTVQAPYPGKPTPLVDLNNNFIVPSSGSIISNFSTSNTGSSSQETFTEEPTTQTMATTGDGSTTMVEILISNRTEAQSKRN